MSLLCILPMVVTVWTLLCKFGREEINSEEVGATQVGQYVDLEHPLTCSGYIVKWHFCYYTNNVQASTKSHRIYFRVYRNESTSQLRQVYHMTMNIELDVGLEPFRCASNSLEAREYLSVEVGDYLAVYLPTLIRPLLVVGYAAPQLLLYRDRRRFPEPFTSNDIPFSELEGLPGSLLHLQADVGKTNCTGVHSHSMIRTVLFTLFVSLLVSEDDVVLETPSSISPQSTVSTSSQTGQLLTPTPEETRPPRIEDKEGFGIESPTNATSDSDGTAAWKLALIATFTTLLFVLAMLLAGLILAVVVYRRMKVERMKKALLEIRPVLHLAIGECTIDVLFKLLWRALFGRVNTTICCSLVQTMQRTTCQCWARTTGSSRVSGKGKGSRGGDGSYLLPVKTFMNHHMMRYVCTSAHLY